MVERVTTDDLQSRMKEEGESQEKPACHAQDGKISPYTLPRKKRLGQRENDARINFGDGIQERRPSCYVGGVLRQEGEGIPSYPLENIGCHCNMYRVNCKLGLLDGEEGSGREGRVWYFDLCIDHLYFTIQATEKYSSNGYTVGCLHRLHQSTVFSTTSWNNTRCFS